MLFIDDATGYVENAGLSVYADSDKIAAFETAYGAALTSDRDAAVLRGIKAVAAQMEEREARRQAAQDAGTL